MKYILIVSVFAVALVSCHNFKEPELRGIQSVNVGKLGFSQSTVTLQIKYFNPNHFNAKLKYAEGDAWMDSSYLGHFKVDTLVNVPANNDFLVPVSLAVDMKYMLQHSLSAFMNKEVDIKVDGSAKAGRNGFYKNFPVKYQGKQNLALLFNQDNGTH